MADTIREKKIMKTLKVVSRLALCSLAKRAKRAAKEPLFGENMFILSGLSK